MALRAEAAHANGERILAVVQELFAERLYDQVSLEDVAGRAEVAVRTVIRRFTSKELLFAAVAESRASKIRGERDKVAEGDVPGAIRRLLSTYETWGDEVLHLLAQERRTSTIAMGVQAGREYHRASVERVFSPLLEGAEPIMRDRRLAQLVMVTDVYAWKVLRRDLGLGRGDVEASLLELVGEIIGKPDESL
jgi:AcrR family transcriptional regulator